MAANKKMTVYGTKEGYTVEFFREGVTFCIVTVAFEDDDPIAEMIEGPDYLSQSEIDLYLNMAKRTALMYEE